MTIHISPVKLAIGIGVVLLASLLIWAFTRPLADEVTLTITTAPQTAAPGDDVVVAYTLENNSKLEYPADTHKLALTLGDSSNTSTLALQEIDQALALNERAEGSFTWPVKQHDFKPADGPFTLNLAYIAMLDSDSARVITETAQPMTLTDPLTESIESLSLSRTDIAVGDRITVSYRITNKTKQPLGAGQPVGLHLGYRAATDGNGFALIKALSDVIAPGTTLEGSTVWKVDNLPEGKQGEVVLALIGSETDNDQQFAETVTPFTVR